MPKEGTSPLRASYRSPANSQDRKPMRNIGPKEIVLLIVEDEPLLRNRLHYERMYFSCATIANSLLFLEKHTPSMILVSSSLGSEFDCYIKDLRKISRDRSIPLILYSPKFE